MRDFEGIYEVEGICEAELTLTFIIVMLKSTMLDIKVLQDLCRNHKIRWTGHILERLVKRHIHQIYVENAILTGNIIEQYPDDYPLPSCLVLGISCDNKKLHVVCGTNNNEIWMITAYYPDESQWNEAFDKRLT